MKVEVIKDSIKDMSIDELDEAVKSFKDIVKNRKEELKEEIIQKAKESVVEDAVLKVRYKESIVEGTVISVREKTFTILIEDDLGNVKKVPRNFSSVVF